MVGALSPRQGLLPLKTGGNYANWGAESSDLLKHFLTP